MRTQSRWTFALILACALPVIAQEGAPNQQSDEGWRRFGAPNEGPPLSGPLSLPAGSWITVRIDQPLSSDRNQAGDTFTATLIQPLVASGRVLARRGQTVAGTVVQVEKAGHVKGTSSMTLELTEIGLADGRQTQVKTTLIERRGNSAVGRDVAVVGTTTAVGAAIGAAADGGFGAGMGAIAGAAASTIGVLATRGLPTVVYPEQALTFRLESPIRIADETAEAFPPVTQDDYAQRASYRQGPPMPPPPPAYYSGYPPYGYPPPYFYGYGPRIVFYGGRGYYGGRGFRRW